MIKVLLVNIIDETDSFACNMTPLGLGYLVSYAQLRMDVDFKIVNTNLMNEVEIYKPDIIGITVVSQNYNKAVGFANDVKQKYEIPIIIGGIHISMMPETLSQAMDIGVIGEGEQTFLELIQHYETQGCFELDKIIKIDGIIYRENDEMKFTLPRHPLHIDEIPIPFRNKDETVVSMFSSRGCPYNCVFCSSTAFWGKPRYFSAEYVVKEMVELINNGAKHISFSDDLFIANKQRLRDIVRLLPKTDTTINCACRANLVDDETIRLLKEINCTTISMGLESGCDNTLRYLKGNSVTVQANSDAIESIKKHGMIVNATFIIGAPFETVEDILQTLQFIKKSKIDNFWIYILTPLPRTLMWDYAVEHSLITPEFEWDNLKFDSESIILSQTIDKPRLHELYKLFKKEQRKKLIKFTIKNVVKERLRRLI